MAVLDIRSAFLNGLRPDQSVPYDVEYIEGLTSVSGRYLAQNRLSEPAKVALGLRLLRGTTTISEYTVAQIAYICKVPRRKLDGHLRRHRSVGLALAKAFAKATEEEQLIFIRMAGIEAVWHILTKAV
jgi:hypothetical protein